MNVGRETASVVRRRVQHLANTAQCVKILFVGKAGAGKSSLINGLVGQKIAKEGAGAQPVTGISALKNPYKCEIQIDDSLVQIHVWDSPGLQNGYQNDEIYLERLRVVLSQVDLLVYCINSKERLGDLAKMGLRKFALLKPEIWSHTVIALTQANLILLEGPTEEAKITQFKGIMTQWTDEISNVLQQCPIPPDMIRKIPFVPTGYHCVTNITPRPWYLHPECNHWLQPFWVNCLGCCKERGQSHLIAINRHRIFNNDTLSDDTTLIEGQRIPFGRDEIIFAQKVYIGTYFYRDGEEGKKMMSWYKWLWYSIFRK